MSDEFSIKFGRFYFKAGALEWNQLANETAYYTTSLVTKMMPLNVVDGLEFSYSHEMQKVGLQFVNTNQRTEEDKAQLLISGIFELQNDN